MSKKVVAIIGSYRKGKVTDTAVTEVLEATRSLGAETEKIYLIDKHIKYCTNCRNCTQKPGPERGKCIHNDDMDEILDTIESADALIIASPMNVGMITAVMKCFAERLAVYRYWPWGKIQAPKRRSEKQDKKALLITSSVMPTFIGRLFASSHIRSLEEIAKSLGAKPIQTLYFGSVAAKPDSTLTEKQKQKARKAGARLV